MNRVYNENGKAIDLDNLQVLSTDGSEVIVYNDDDLAYKVYRDNYKFDHKTAEELDYLATLDTSRILMPKEKLIKDNEFIGYTMKYIPDKKDILCEPMSLMNY